MRRVGIAGLLSLSLLLGGCSLLTSGTDTTSSTTSQQSESSRNQTTSTTGNAQQTYKQLAKMTYQSGSAAAIKVNSGKSTLAASQWKILRLITVI